MYLSCPACPNLLHQSHYGSVSAHLCSTGCGGIWIGHDSVESVVKTPRIVDRMLAATEHVSPLRHDEIRRCPDCQERLDLWNVKGQAGVEVEIDICPKCQGLWLDQGEVSTLILIHRKGQHQTERRAHSDYNNNTVTVGDMALAGVDTALDIAIYTPNLAAGVVEMGFDAVAGAAEMTVGTIEVLPGAVEALPETVSVVAEGAGAILEAGGGVALEAAGASAEVVGAVAEATGNAIGEAIGGLFSIFDLFG